MKRSRQGLWAACIVVPALLAALTASALAQPTERTYDFVGVDHPVQMWREGDDQWAYFGTHHYGDSSVTAAKARTALVPQGFVEDATQRPWYRFVKGKEEVVVCNFNEFSMGIGMGTQAPHLEHASNPRGSQPYAVVLVKNGPGSHASPEIFAIKKTLFGW